MSFSIRQRPSFAAATTFRANSTRQQPILTEQVQSIDLSTSLNQRPDQHVQNRFNNPQLQNKLNSLVGNDLITNQKLDMVNDFLNQIHIDPMVGFEEGALEQAMNQFGKMQQMIQDQVLNNTNTGQGTYTTTTTQGDGYTTTTVTNSNGETRQSFTKHESGHSRDQSTTGNVTHKDEKGNVITEEEYCEETENRAEDCPEEEKSGGEEGSGNGDGNGNNDENKIIAETEWPMGYQLNDFVGKHESSVYSMGIDLQLVQSMHQTEYFFGL